MSLGRRFKENYKKYLGLIKEHSVFQNKNLSVYPLFKKPVEYDGLVEEYHDYK